VAYDNIAPARFRSVNLNRVYPAGQFPIFSLYGRVTWINTVDPNTPPNPGDPYYRSYYGAPSSSNGAQVGGAVDGGHFYGINFTKNLNSTFVGTATIWFLIFNNIF